MAYGAVLNAERSRSGHVCVSRRRSWPDVEERRTIGTSSGSKVSTCAAGLRNCRFCPVSSARARFLGAVADGLGALACLLSQDREPTRGHDIEQAAGLRRSGRAASFACGSSLLSHARSLRSTGARRNRLDAPLARMRNPGRAPDRMTRRVPLSAQRSGGRKARTAHSGLGTGVVRSCESDLREMSAESRHPVYNALLDRVRRSAR